MKYIRNRQKSTYPITWLTTALVTGLLVVGGNFTTSVQAQTRGRWLEVSRLTGTVQVKNQGNNAKTARTGDRLDEPGDQIQTRARSAAVLKLDSDIGRVTVAAKTSLSIQKFDTLADGARITILNVSKGQARVKARSFSNPNSRLELRTPSGVAAVRGTEFGVNVLPTGQTNVGTIEGAVEASAQGETVMLRAGFYSVIKPGEPPTQPKLLDRALSLILLQQERTDSGMILAGWVAPNNTVLVDGRTITIQPSGRFDVYVTGRSVRPKPVTIVVQNPVGEAREYLLQTAWPFDEIDDD